MFYQIYLFLGTLWEICPLATAFTNNQSGRHCGSEIVPFQLIFLSEVGAFRPSTVVASSPRKIYVPPEEPPFGGDDGEPESAAPSFVWGYLIDKHRLSLGETKTMKFADDYLPFLFLRGADRYKEELEHTYAATETVNPAYGEYNRVVLRQENPFEFELLDQTISLRRFKMSEIPPGGLTMPNRTLQLTKFLVSNPESRLQLRPRSQQLGGFLGGRTPYS